ncbi:MAG: carboxypeptidase-like regulatory domain-containing protein [Acidobacteriia bacterium]|nr:carboxypeptidase-like regulatory domain-containing protein [Terriglobia bacterium]
MQFLRLRKVHSGAWVVLLTAILFVLFDAQAYAQLAGANLSGVVQDESGSAVPNANVSIQNVANGTVRVVTSNPEGLYSAPNLLPGVYDVTVKASGFETMVQRGLTLSVGANQVLNLPLKVGQLQQAVEVSAAPPSVDTTSSTMSGTVEQKTVVELPLNGRDWTQLATLQPGITAIRAQTSTNSTANRAQRGFGNQLSDSGHRPNENTYRIDGINVNDYTNGAPGSVLAADLGVDAIQEFSVVTTNYTAEYGRTSGAVINAITKSGTNQLHGTAYFFDRDQVFDARNFFDPAKIPPFQQKQFGASAGAPIIKDKLFIFGDYEAVRQNLSETFSDVVPSAAAEAGNMCSIPIASGPNACSPHTITVSPNIVPYLALYPNPATAQLLPVGGPSDNGNAAIYHTFGGKISNEDYFTLRGDYKISNTDSLALSYFFDNSPQTVPDALNNVVNKELARRQMAGVTETHIFTPSLVNIVRIGYNRGAGLANQPYIANNPASVNVGLAIPGQALAGGPPQFLFSGSNSPVTMGGEGISHWQHRINSYQAYDDLSLIRGLHSLRFGFAFERIQYEVGSGGLLEGENNGSITFASTVVGGATIADAMENFLLDKPRTGGATPLASLATPGIGQQIEPRDSIFGGYVQDDWRARPYFTVNLGLRYEMLTNPTEAYNRFTRLNSFTAPPGSGPCTNLYPNTFGPTSVPGCPVPISKLWNSNPTVRDFDPRVGFSWDPFHDGKTAVRAGYGIFDVLPLPYIYSDGFVVTYPFSIGFTAPVNSIAQGAFPNIIPYVAQGVPGGRYVEPNPKRAYSQNWNLNIEHQISRNLTAMVGYVGSITTHNSFTTDQTNMVLPTLVNGVFTWPLPIGSGTVLDPNVRTLRQIFWDNTAKYEGLQSELKLRPTHNLQGQITYVYSHCSSGGDAAQFGDPFQNSLTSLQYFNPAMRYGPCDFDLRQNLSINYLYDIPGPKRDSALRWVAGGWQFGGIGTVSSGVPFTVVTGGDPLGSNSTDAIDFPNRVSGCNPIQGGVHYLNASCFIVAPITAAGPVLGNNGRNSLVGPRLVNFDMSFVKNTYVPKISENFNLQLRFEFFNIFNHTNLQAPVDNNSMGGTLGLIDSTSTPARIIQLGAKIVW